MHRILFYPLLIILVLPGCATYPVANPGKAQLAQYLPDNASVYVSLEVETTREILFNSYASSPGSPGIPMNDLLDYTDHVYFVILNQPGSQLSTVEYIFLGRYPDSLAGVVIDNSDSGQWERIDSSYPRWSYSTSEVITYLSNPADNLFIVRFADKKDINVNSTEENLIAGVKTLAQDKADFLMNSSIALILNESMQAGPVSINGFEIALNPASPGALPWIGQINILFPNQQIATMFSGGIRMFPGMLSFMNLDLDTAEISNNGSTVNISNIDISDPQEFINQMGRLANVPGLFN